MKKIISLLAILLFIVECSTTENISQGKKLYYPQYKDFGYHYIAEYCKDSLYAEVHFHIIKQDTFVFNNGKWYPMNLNLINK